VDGFTEEHAVDREGDDVAAGVAVRAREGDLIENLQN
jgi:hypothetical protein